MWRSVDKVELAGRGGPDCSEDRFGTSGPMAWILDGASSVSAGESVTAEKSDAIWMVEHLTSELKALCYEPGPLKDIVARALRNIAAAAKREWTGTPEWPPSAALGVVRHAGDHVDIFVLADVSVIVRAEAGAQWFIDRRVDEHNRPAADEMREALLDPQVSFKEAIERARPFLAEPRRSAMNKPGGYWVASIDATAAAHALTGTIDGVDDVILASDGFMRTVELFGLVPSVDGLFDRDFEALAARLREIERGPDSRKFPRWSVSDDVCAHQLHWEQ